jgi:hypothetical protein
MGRRKKHTVNGWLVMTGDLELLPLKVLLHDELALSQLPEQVFILTLVDVMCQILLAAVSETNAFAKTAEVNNVPTERICGFGSLINHV